ncbi:two-component system sensor histidine kinase SenX3 [Stackebrandtia albiflava]|uniref:Sensor-like histidine kinase SenX3 n=1 Tax=Stackebrandtia albiflava TaxID=406432 RepID=A0A562UR59_9ACTN|nr:ATP-binding protein [Stackebrandtia albiflava]TWJ08102.1 two-component system sensor histidine kinase SenX3 [Stackebrandtia albiflava]
MTTAPDRHRRFTGGVAALATLGLGAVAGAVGYTALRRRRAAEPPPSCPALEWPRVLAALHTAVVVIGPDGIEHANPAAEQLGAVDRGELRQPDLRTIVTQVRATGEPRSGELELESTGTVAVRVHASPLPEDRVLLELTDVTELHRVEKVRRDFVANVSHELKTPVGALQLLTEALADAVDDPQAAARFTSRIQHESARMGRLVSELLELSRLQGAEPLPAFSPVSVDRVVNEAADRSRTAANAKRIALHRTGESGATVSGSESQLATAVGNLVRNAIVYSPEDTTVTIDVTETRGWVKVAVIDQGIGIAPADQARVFERFYRADPARSRATGGTGLGLAIVKHIAGNHAGRVEVSSMPGNGSVFTLLLPSVALSARESAPPPDEIDEQVNRNQKGTP